ncbi:hypothetical protein AKJ16_DCAP15143 [Drosera capensis]
MLQWATFSLFLPTIEHLDVEIIGDLVFLILVFVWSIVETVSYGVGTPIRAIAYSPWLKILVKNGSVRPQLPEGVDNIATILYTRTLWDQRVLCRTQVHKCTWWRAVVAHPVYDFVHPVAVSGFPFGDSSARINFRFTVDIIAFAHSDEMLSCLLLPVHGRKASTTKGGKSKRQVTKKGQVEVQIDAKLNPSAGAELMH